MAINRRRYATWRGTIPAGGAEVVTVFGTFVTCLASTADFKIALDDGAPADFMQGLTFVAAPGDSFAELRIENPSAFDVEVTIGFGSGQIIDARATFADAIPIGSSPNFVSGPDIEIPAGGVLLLAAADPKRRKFILRHRSINAREIRLGDSAVAATEGHEVDPGEVFSADVSGDVWGYNPHTAPASVTVTVIAG